MIRTYKSGKVVEKSKFWVPEQTRKRSPKKATSSSRKQDENERDAIKQLARLINCNFAHGDLWITLSYSEEKLINTCKAGGDPMCFDGFEGLDEMKQACDKQLTLFIRRMSREAKRLGVPFKYIALTSDMDGKTGELVRPHHHILLPRLAYDLCCKHWHFGDVDYQILRNQDDYTPLAVYLIKQVRRQENDRRWKASRNLLKPKIVEEITEKKGMLRAPAGAIVRDSGHYDDESGNHYIRYIPLPRPKSGGHKEGGEPLEF